ncbi:MAG: hypothetical protein HY645_02775 [Acidobacteria bacterium]|nr:hypothetical protein [Acidobacteriota bacterium]
MGEPTGVVTDYTTAKGAAVPWYRQATPYQRKTLLAAWLGWMMDSMDLMLYSMVVSFVIRDLGASQGIGGLWSR